MWCPECRADVAAELSIDNRRMLCARCQTELGTAAAATLPVTGTTPRTAETERDARELLARWSAQNMLDVTSPMMAANSLVKPSVSTESIIAKSDLRFDRPITAVPAPSSSFLNAMRDKQADSSVIPMTISDKETAHDENAARQKNHRASLFTESTDSDRRPVDSIPPKKAPVEHGLSLEHNAMDHNGLHQPRRFRTSWSTLAGQLFAYCGVGLLTCGTVLVMWSYFGGPTSYMPTGWLVAAVGQMLLFLGVVTLISSGMEQTTAEIVGRIDFLAEEIHHMGNAMDDLEQELRQSRSQRSSSNNDRDTSGSMQDAA